MLIELSINKNVVSVSFKIEMVTINFTFCIVRTAEKVFFYFSGYCSAVETFTDRDGFKQKAQTFVRIENW